MNLFNSLFSIFRKKNRVGLALSGGVARGIAHIGVLKILHKHKIPIDFIAGTSSGAMIGVLFAAGMEPQTMEKAASRLGWLRFVRIVLQRHGPMSTEEIKNFVIRNIGNLKFSDLKIPFVAVASDLRSGQEVVLREGHVADAVAASCAFPGIFVPIHKGNAILVDGGLTTNIPTSVVKSMGANFTIAVDVVPAKPLTQDLDNVLQIFGRSLDLAMKRLSEEGRKAADVLIEPDIPQDIWHLDVDKAKKLIKAGEEAAEGHILEIKTRLFLNT